MSEPGWYGEPGNAALERYWDGHQWTPDTRAVTAESQEPVPLAPRARAVPSKAVLLAGAAVALIAVGLAVWWIAIRTSTITIRGTLDLQGTRYDGVYEVSAPDKIGNQTCHGTGGYSDIGQGATVTVTGPDGKTVATSGLEEGIFIQGTGACIFGYELTIPDDLDSYGLAVSHRGVLQFSLSEMKDGPGLTLND